VWGFTSGSRNPQPPTGACNRGEAEPSGLGENGAMSGIEVPGGIVALDPYRGRPVAFWVKRMGLGLLTLGYSAFSGFDQDIVIRSSDGGRELYREGPYRQDAANQAMNRIVAEIRSTGLEPFLRERQIERSRIGPIAESSGRTSLFQLNVDFWRNVSYRILHRSDDEADS